MVLVPVIGCGRSYCWIRRPGITLLNHQPWVMGYGSRTVQNARAVVPGFGARVFVGYLLLCGFGWLVWYFL